MSDVVLVHGSFHGGWAWEGVAPALRDAGHVVHTPTLTGLGERSHLVGPHVGLGVNVDDVARYVEYRDLTDVVLVGHSYGGMVITGAAEQVADRLDRLVYLDGFVPEDGQSAWDIAPEAEQRWRAQMAKTGTDWLVAPSDPAEKYGETGPVADRHRERLTPMAMLTHSEPVRLPENAAASLPRAYVECTGDDLFRDAAEAARADGLDVYELDAHHNPLVYQPDRAADCLCRVIGD